MFLFLHIGYDCINTQLAFQILLFTWFSVPPNFDTRLSRQVKESTASASYRSRIYSHFLWLLAFIFKPTPVAVMFKAVILACRSLILGSKGHRSTAKSTSSNLSPIECLFSFQECAYDCIQYQDEESRWQVASFLNSRVLNCSDSFLSSNTWVLSMIRTFHQVNDFWECHIFSEWAELHDPSSHRPQTHRALFKVSDTFNTVNILRYNLFGLSVSNALNDNISFYKLCKQKPYVSRRIPQLVISANNSSAKRDELSFSD